MENKFLISGTKSGIGKYLKEQLGGGEITRSTTNEEFNSFKKGGAEIIIHCAFNSNRDVNSNNLKNYMDDNIFLTKRLLKIPHKKFIFISSVDVYPKDEKMHDESEVLELEKIDNIYGIAKIMSESLVKEASQNNLILRLSAMLGKYSRKNSAIKIIEDQDPALGLSSESVFNYILYSDVLDFINLANSNNLSGTYNVVSSENTQLKDIAQMYGKSVKFGNHKYHGGNISNAKITALFPSLNRKSIDTIKRFVDERKS